MSINKKKLNRRANFDKDVVKVKIEWSKNPLEGKVKKIVNIVRRIRRNGSKLIVRKEDKFKEDFADFMINDLQPDLDEIEDIVHEIDKAVILNQKK